MEPSLTASFSKFALLLLDEVAGPLQYHQLTAIEMSAITTQTEFSNFPRTVLYSSSLKGTRGAAAEDLRGNNARKDSLITFGERNISNKDISILVEQLPVALPSHQDVLLLFGPRQSYTLTSDWPIPTPQLPGELVVKVRAIGLNPFDWKSAYVVPRQVLLSRF